MKNPLFDSLPKTINCIGLPQKGGTRLNPEKLYSFWLGYPDYLSNKEQLVLRIPEHGSRSAEGRPLFPEQAAWVDALIRREQLAITAVWFSHWRIDNRDALRSLLQLLEK